MVMIRRISRGLAVLAVALAAGHLVQTLTEEERAQVTQAERPTQVEQVSAGPEARAPVALPLPADLAAESSPALAKATTTPDPAAEEPAPVLMAAALPDAALPLDAPALPPPTALAALSPETATPGIAAPDTPVAAQPPMLLPAPLPEVAADCAVTLDLIPEAQAMIGLTLVAPCQPDARVVLRHAGLAVTARTNATGSLFVSLPALQTDGEVSVLFPDQTVARAAIDIPELRAMRRFGVQWMGDDSFALQALENGAAFGTPGNISAANPGSLAPLAPLTAGVLSVLGDGTVDRPMLAQVYTYPSDPKTSVEILVEAEVTEATCNRDMLGETLSSVGGAVEVIDLTLATPPCDAVGDILVLKNLAPALKIAAN